MPNLVGNTAGINLNVYKLYPAALPQASFRGITLILQTARPL